MKILNSIIAVLLLVPALASADYQCELEVFGAVIIGNGASINAAKVDTHLKCLNSNGNIFCSLDKITKCSSNVYSQQVYCELNAPFDKFYYSVQPTREMAVQQTRSQCLSEQSAMFCRPEKATCLNL